VNRRLKLVLLALVSVAPCRLKVLLYRKVFGYRIGPAVHIGFSVLAADDVDIGAGVSIGHGNIIVDVKRLVIGERATIGEFNLIRGGDEVRLGAYSELLRRNELNGIADARATAPRDPRLIVGRGTVITDGHRLDFRDKIELGDRVIIGGRNSSLWTHTRRRYAPICIGARTYLSSEIRVAPGAVVPARSIVALGSVVTGQLSGEGSLIGGMPARVLRPLDEDDRQFVDSPTRDDLPSGI
jgi:acetyltransferase-like isoleucine patch superfamily enzyme